MYNISILPTCKNVGNNKSIPKDRWQISNKVIQAFPMPATSSAVSTIKNKICFVEERKNYLVLMFLIFVTLMVITNSKIIEKYFSHFHYQMWFAVPLSLSIIDKHLKTSME